MSRRFYEGWREEIDGIEFRVVRGRKHPDDLVLEWWDADGGWRKVTMRAAALLVDFLYENEDVLYPRPQYQGGEKLMEFLRFAVTAGWTSAGTTLQGERQVARLRNVPLGARST